MIVNYITQDTYSTTHHYTFHEKPVFIYEFDTGMGVITKTIIYFYTEYSDSYLYPCSDGHFHQIYKQNEGRLSNFYLWLSEEDDSLAMSIIGSYINRQLNIARNSYTKWQNLWKSLISDSPHTTNIDGIPKGTYIEYGVRRQNLNHYPLGKKRSKT